MATVPHALRTKKVAPDAAAVTPAPVSTTVENPTTPGADMRFDLEAGSPCPSLSSSEGDGGMEGLSDFDISKQCFCGRNIG